MAAPMAPTTEHIFRCASCGEKQSWTTSAAVTAAGTWHVYEQHRDIWEQLGNRTAPVMGRPETLGRAFEDWELQS